MSKGKLIVLEGLDGSGKGTQAKLLAKHLTVTGHLVREITFPDYDSDSSALVKMYLAGQFGDKPDDVNAYAASSFYAVDRYAGYKSDWGKFYEEGGILIADRYTTSNAVHQCSKLPPEQWDAFLQWLFDYEYHLLGLPAPDKVIYLQVDPAVSQRLMTARYHGDETRKDVHERTPNIWPAAAGRQNTVPHTSAGIPSTARQGRRCGALRIFRERSELLLSLLFETKGGILYHVPFDAAVRLGGGAGPVAGPARRHGGVCPWRCGALCRGAECLRRGGKRPH